MLAVLKLRHALSQREKVHFVVRFKNKKNYSEALARALIQNVMNRCKDILDARSRIETTSNDVFGMFIPVHPSTCGFPDRIG